MSFSTDIAQWIRSFGQFIYNRQDHQILGRDGKRWSMIQSLLLLLLDRIHIFLS